jgi:hypothetical protein
MNNFHLDLTKFKRVGSDKKSTTLQHDNGHKLILSHANLDQDKLSALSKLPELKEENGGSPRRFAEAGTVTPDPAPLEVEPVSPDDSEQPAQAPAEPTPEAPAQPAPAPAQPEAPAPPENQPPEAAPAEPTPQAAPPLSPQQQAEKGTQEAFKPGSQNVFANPVAGFQHLQQQDAALAYDLANSHIHAKTMSELFGEKDTLGKIGTVFSMLVGGMGSSILHEENPAFKAMQNQISQDLEAQKQNINNKQTLLGLNRQRFGDLETALHATRVQMNIKALNDMGKIVASKTPGSKEWVDANNALATASQFFDMSNQNINTQIAAKQAFLHQFQNQNSGPEGAFQAQQSALRATGDPRYIKMAEQADERHVPGLDGKTTLPIPQERRNALDAMNVLDNKAADLLAFAKAHKFTKDPLKRIREAAIGAQKAEEMVNFYNGSIQPGGALTQGRMAWLDKQINKNPTSIWQDVSGNNDRLQEIQNSNSQRRATMLKGLGFTGQIPGVAQGAQSPQGGSQEMRTINGMQYQKVDGGWKKVK